MSILRPATPVWVTVRSCRMLDNGRYELVYSCGCVSICNYPYNKGEKRVCDWCTDEGGNR